MSTELSRNGVIMVRIPNKLLYRAVQIGLERLMMDSGGTGMVGREIFDVNAGHEGLFFEVKYAPAVDDADTDTPTE